MSAPEVQTITAIRLTTEGDILEVEISDDLATLQGQVGGYLQMIYTPATLHEKTIAFLNEEGKIKGLPRNDLATRLVGSILLPGDYISGNMILCGMGDEGETESCPDSLECVVELVR